jgi:hypothetical protein
MFTFALMNIPTLHRIAAGRPWVPVAERAKFRGFFLAVRSCMNRRGRRGDAAVCPEKRDRTSWLMSRAVRGEPRRRLRDHRPTGDLLHDRRSRAPARRGGDRLSPRRQERRQRLQAWRRGRQSGEVGGTAIRACRPRHRAGAGLETDANKQRVCNNPRG